jgi:hypothetical protein
VQLVKCVEFTFSEQSRVVTLVEGLVYSVRVMWKTVWMRSGLWRGLARAA